ncbi:MAG: hypothetical protein R3A12_09870 [Ignavibacteria bacterium]
MVVEDNNVSKEPFRGAQIKEAASSGMQPLKRRATGCNIGILGAHYSDNTV